MCSYYTLKTHLYIYIYYVYTLTSLITHHVFSWNAGLPKSTMGHHLSALRPPRFTRKTCFLHSFEATVISEGIFSSWLWTHLNHMFGQEKKMVHLPPKVFGLKKQVFWNHLHKNSPFKGAHPTWKIKGILMFMYTVWVLSNIGSQWVVDFMKTKDSFPNAGVHAASASFLSITWANWSFALFFSEHSSTCHRSETRKRKDRKHRGKLSYNS